MATKNFNDLIVKIHKIKKEIKDDLLIEIYSSNDPLISKKIIHQKSAINFSAPMDEHNKKLVSNLLKKMDKEEDLIKIKRDFMKRWATIMAWGGIGAIIINFFSEWIIPELININLQNQLVKYIPLVIFLLGTFSLLGVIRMGFLIDKKEKKIDSYINEKNYLLKKISENSSKNKY